MRRPLTPPLILVAALGLLPAAGSAGEPAVGARFSDLAAGAALAAEWRELAPKASLPRTSFSLVNDAGRTVLRMESIRSASALARRLRIDPRTHPILAWEWKVTRLVEGSDLARKSGDDFPARLYVFFDFDSSRLPFTERAKLALARAVHGDTVPLAALCYVWDTKAPVGTIVPNAYTDRVRMIVVGSGPRGVGDWVGVRRNVLEDYRAAFGEDPSGITGIALGADTDDTGERALSFFGDIAFQAR